MSNSVARSEASPPKKPKKKSKRKVVEVIVSTEAVSEEPVPEEQPLKKKPKKSKRKSSETVPEQSPKKKKSKKLKHTKEISPELKTSDDVAAEVESPSLARRGTTDVLDVPQSSYPEWPIPQRPSSKLQPQSSSMSAFATVESHSWAIAGHEFDLQDDLLSKEVVIVEEDEEEVQVVGEKPECEGEKDASGTHPNQTPSATHVAKSPVQEGPLIEKGVHTPILTPLSHTMDNLSSSGIKEARETTVLPFLSQRRLGDEIRAPSPKGSTYISTDALFASHSLLELNQAVSETPLRHIKTIVLEQPESSLNPSIPFGSEPLEEFKTFVAEIFTKPESLQQPIIPSSEITEALKENTAAVKTLTELTKSLQSELKQVKASAVTKVDLSVALVSYVPFADQFQSFQDELFSANRNLVTDLIEAGYSNYSSLEQEIKKMVNSAIVMGQASASSQACLNQLYTKRDFEAMVQSLAQTIVRQNEAIARDFRRSHRNTAKFVQQVSNNLVLEGVRLRTSLRNYAADIRFHSHLNINSVVLSVEDLITRLEATMQGILNSILTLNPTTCSAEASPQHDNQEGNDHDDHEGEDRQHPLVPKEPSSATIPPPPQSKASDQPLSSKGNKRIEKTRPLEKGIKIGEPSVPKKPSSTEGKKKKKDKGKQIAKAPPLANSSSDYDDVIDTGALSDPEDAQLIAALKESKAMASGKIPPHRPPRECLNPLREPLTT
ncbi:hypothetical protein OSB04_023968 [Centaurea solstitialis]|uniref:Uncharacterized protein n=1 Tax=Centaurea solstitialis TaxID=347529 RepID=A0AA38SYL4_9ASTR|nr:hypothetical protein OSB04_023968 [Centaurea solstitialis]